MRNLIVLILSFVFWVGCQQAPTKVYQSQPVTAKGGSSEIMITDQTVIIDARPAFEYTVAHLNGSIHLRPEDFTQKETPFQGLLDPDHFALARRLARLGITPDTPVVVVGRGLEGKGEEGRMAWTLKFLGVKDVRFADIEYFSLPLSTAEAPPRAHAPIWKPVVDESLEVSKAEVQNVMKTVKRPNEPRTVIIDVRPSEEYLGKTAKAKTATIDIGAINIPWTEFFTPKGLVHETVRSKLESVGITTDREIIVIANQGVESAAVTLALRELGYKKAANFSGGYVLLNSKKSK